MSVGPSETKKKKPRRVIGSGFQLGTLLSYPFLIEPSRLCSFALKQRSVMSALSSSRGPLFVLINVRKLSLGLLLINYSVRTDVPRLHVSHILGVSSD